MHPSMIWCFNHYCPASIIPTVQFLFLLSSFYSCCPVSISAIKMLFLLSNFFSYFNISTFELLLHSLLCCFIPYFDAFINHILHSQFLCFYHFGNAYIPALMFTKWQQNPHLTGFLTVVLLVLNYSTVPLFHCLTLCPIEYSSMYFSPLHTILYCTFLHCVLYCTILYCTILYFMWMYHGTTWLFQFQKQK